MKEKRVIVTGASSGIGLATARLFLENGATVALMGRRRRELEKTAGEYLESGRAIVTPADLSDDRETEAAFGAVLGQMGRLDVLVNAAGILKAGDIAATTFELWDESMNINLRSVFHLMKLAVPYLEKSRGNIVNVSSVTGLRAFPGVLADCVSKAGLAQLTRCAALEMAPRGVRVNAVNPGVVVSNLHRRSGMKEDAYAAFLERSKETHPLGRPGAAEEVADLIWFLASDRAGWITGETISIDGGRHLTCAR